MSEFTYQKKLVIFRGALVKKNTLYISIYLDLRKADWLWLATSYIQKNIFINDVHWSTYGLSSQSVSTPEPPQKNVSYRKCDFSGT